MTFPNLAVLDDLGGRRGTPTAPAEDSRDQVSAVSWGAVFAGAAAAAALSLILLILGTGLGLSSVSPWAQDGVSAATFGLTAILWLTATQLIASGMGGYLAGRLRTRWVAVQGDEVYFRDTAHGFLSWAVASLTTAALLTSVIGSIVGGGVQAGATVAGGVASTATAAVAGGAVSAGKEGADSAPMGYLLDTLFRRDASAAAPPADAAGSTSGEVARIFTATLRRGSLSPEDQRYVGQLVAQRTGLSQQAAEQRVGDTYARAQTQLRDAQTAAKEAADTARRASAYAALWLFVSLLIGAFAASFAATLGGRQRDV